MIDERNQQCFQINFAQQAKRLRILEMTNLFSSRRRNVGRDFSIEAPILPRQRAVNIGMTRPVRTSSAMSSVVSQA